MEKSEERNPAILYVCVALCRYLTFPLQMCTVSRVPLYRVHFKQSDLWADYDGKPEDTLELEIYEHWLEAA